MEKVLKPFGGAMIGVTIPIGLEYAVKGARIGDPNTGFKVSGVTGVALGIPEVAGAYMGYRRGWKDENVAMLAAMGGAKVATGISILILDELRKRALYAFRRKRGETLPIGEGKEELEREEYPTVELVEEI